MKKEGDISLFQDITVPDYVHSRQLLKSFKREGYTGSVFVMAVTENDYKILADSGASYLLQPFQSAVNQFYTFHPKDLLIKK